MDGVEVDSHVDCVNLKAIEKDEGFVTMNINGRPTEMKVDTGAKCNVMSLDTFKGLNNGKQLVQQRKAASLAAYGGTRIETSGIATLQCCLNEQNHLLPFFIVDRAVQPLLGFRACMEMEVVKICPDVHQVSVEGYMDFSSQKFVQYKDLFSNELGGLPVMYSMTLDPNIQPMVRPAHRIPVAMQERVKAEHDANLRKVLERAQEVNLRLNPDNCNFRLDQVAYVGHIFTSNGLKADPSKTAAINDRSSHPLQPLAEGQVVRMQTAKGYDRLGTVNEMSKEPRSYIVQADGKDL